LDRRSVIQTLTPIYKLCAFAAPIPARSAVAKLLISFSIVQAQRPHFAAQPSEAYTRLTRGQGPTLAIADLISTSLRTLQLQTITAHSWLKKLLGSQ
jgi:hypothetical protein